jgi:histidinol phosphatase-like enzyme (inositol monophosphatase family)
MTDLANAGATEMNSDPTNPDQWHTLEDGRLTALLEIARSAGDHTLRYFGDQSLTVDAKSDDSPVTVADREAEQLVRKRIAEAFPDDTVQGEEFAETSGDSQYRWVVDPIDGTKSFVCGVPLYSTLLALEKAGQPIGGVIFIPALGEWVVAAVGHGCWHQGRRADGGATAWRRANVSQRHSLDQAVFLSSQVDSFDGRGAAKAYKTLEEQCWITRTWGDGYGYLLVATGRADVMIDPVCNAWDVAAILPVVTEAGGRFTDWTGAATVRGGDGVGTNGHLHEAVLKALR